MFVLLEHDTTRAAEIPPTERGVHWDLLIEVAGSGRLPTWRLSRNPLQTNEDIPTERIDDHRRLYLQFEGEVSGGRGQVRRVASGDVRIELLTEGRVVLSVTGEALRGQFEIVRESAERMVFRRRPQTDSVPGGGTGGRTQT